MFSQGRPGGRQTGGCPASCHLFFSPGLVTIFMAELALILFQQLIQALQHFGLYRRKLPGIGGRKKGQQAIEVFQAKARSFQSRPDLLFFYSLRQQAASIVPGGPGNTAEGTIPLGFFFGTDFSRTSRPSVGLGAGLAPFERSLRLGWGFSGLLSRGLLQRFPFFAQELTVDGYQLVLLRRLLQFPGVARTRPVFGQVLQGSELVVILGEKPAAVPAYFRLYQPANRAPGLAQGPIQQLGILHSHLLLRKSKKTPTDSNVGRSHQASRAVCGRAPSPSQFPPILYQSSRPGANLPSERMRLGRVAHNLPNKTQTLRMYEPVAARPRA